MRFLALALGLSLGCAADEAQRGAEARETTAARKPSAPEPSKAEPPPKAPVPPEGAGLMTTPQLFVQRCDDAHPCPSLRQAEGTSHCAALDLGGGGWRLPEKREVAGFAGVEGLENLSGYHWTKTPFEQDATQLWIVDPTSDQPTTIPGDRKPFTIRCVREP